MDFDAISVGGVLAWLMECLHEGYLKPEELMPQIVESLFGFRKEFLKSVARSASRIASRNASVFFESKRNVEILHRFLKKKREVDGSDDQNLLAWLTLFDSNPNAAALDYWYEIHKGLHETLREFQ